MKTATRRQMPGSKIGPGLGLRTGCLALTLVTFSSEGALIDYFVIGADGRAPLERQGRAVAGLGDVNGDGVPDFATGLVTAPEGAGGNAVSARVYSGADGTLLWEIQRPAHTCVESINSVATAGDLTGDGRSEFIVGTPRASQMDCGVGDDAGVVRIFNGATGLIFSQRQGNPGDLLGWSVAGVEDVNGDGTPDLVLGAPGAGGGAGRVDLVSGTAAGALLGQAHGEAAGDAFGWSVAAVADLSGDGRPDALVGAPFAQGQAGSIGLGAGRAYAYAWRTPGGFVRHLTVMGDGTDDALGYAVAGAGDVTQDGRAEFVAGAPGVDRSAPVDPGDGYARLYSGADGTALRTWGGAAPGPGPHHLGDLLGFAVAGLGDCDGDGQMDVAVGAPQTGGGRGAIYIFHPNSGIPIRIHTGDEANDFLGVSLASAGDVLRGPPGQQELLAGATGVTVNENVGAGRVLLLACHPVPKPDLETSPAELDLGDVVQGASTMGFVTLRNVGEAPLHIGAIGLDAGADSSLTLGALPALPLILDPNASVAAAVQFAPESLGPAGARLVIESDDPEEPRVAVPVGGRGVGIDIEVVPGSLAFGDVRIGDSISGLVLVRNVGNLPLEVNSMAISAGGDVFSLFPEVASDPEQRVLIVGVEISDGRIRFTIESGDPLEAHHIEETSDLANPVWTEVANVTFTQIGGNLIQAEIPIEEDALHFYRVVDSAPPPVVPDGAILVPLTLAPGETVRLHVIFHPGSVGAALGSLRVESNDPDEMTIEVALSGTGVVFNQWPVAGIKAEPALPGPSPHAVSFLGRNFSRDADGQIAAYAWDFGDGSSSVLADPTHDYTPAGYEFLPGPAARYIARLTVTDDEGAQDPTSVAVLVGACPLRSRFYGHVHMRGLPAADGAAIIAQIEEAEVARSRAQSYLGGTVYASEVPPIPRTGGCALSREGAEVRFLVDGIPAVETGIWHHAWDQELDLTIPLNIGVDRGLDWVSEEGDARLQFDPGSVPEVTLIDFQDLPVPSHPFDHFANHAFRMEARRLDGTAVTRFNKPYRLTVSYAEADWQGGGISDEKNLNLYWWDGVRWAAFLPCPNCGLDTGANRLTVELDHLTEFALGTDQGMAAPVTVTLTPVADSYILSSAPTVNYGSAPIIYVGRQSSTSAGRALFRFDLNAIPQGATVQNAGFLVYLMASSATPATLPVEVRRIDAAWQEGTVAWSTPLTYTGSNIVSAVGTALNDTSWNVTSLVQTWVDGTPNYGLALSSQDENNLGWRGFASREQTLSSAKPPRFVVTYREK
jgi:PKD domain/FG-GAP repeat